MCYVQACRRTLVVVLLQADGSKRNCCHNSAEFFKLTTFNACITVWVYFQPTLSSHAPTAVIFREGHQLSFPVRFRMMGISIVPTLDTSIIVFSARIPVVSCLCVCPVFHTLHRRILPRLWCLHPSLFPFSTGEVPLLERLLFLGSSHASVLLGFVSLFVVRLWSWSSDFTYAVAWYPCLSRCGAWSCEYFRSYTSGWISRFRILSRCFRTQGVAQRSCAGCFLGNI